MSVSTEVLEWGRERARAGPWRQDAGVALLAPLPGPPLSSTFVRRCLDTLTGRGFTSVVTAALSPLERPSFLALGFVEHERLCLLSHDLDFIPPRSKVALHRGRREHRPGVLAVDASAFDPFWRLDETGLDEALGATPQRRWRVVLDDAPDAGTRPGVVAFAITGRSGTHGYLQRLAVAPAHRRQGVGRALTVDALRWLRRRATRKVLVNTQPDNVAAIEMYLSVGFRREPSELAVLRRELTG